MFHYRAISWKLVLDNKKFVNTWLKSSSYITHVDNVIDTIVSLQKKFKIYTWIRSLYKPVDRVVGLSKNFILKSWV